jgi:hypothetical protein
MSVLPFKMGVNMMSAVKMPPIGRDYPYVVPRAFALDLFGFGKYTFPLGAAGAMAFSDPLEGTETSWARNLDTKVPY